CQCEKQGLTEYASALLIRRKFGAIVIVSRRRDLIYGGEVRVYESVARAEGVHEVSIAPYQISDKTPGFLEHGLYQLRVEERERTLLARRGLRAVKAEPLGGKLIERGPGTRIGEHAAGNTLHVAAVAEVAVGGDAQQLFVRHGVPQRIGKPTGRRVGLPLGL